MGPVAVDQVRWVDQVHGATVITVGERSRPSSLGPAAAGSPARAVVAVGAGTGDALVSMVPSVALTVLTADCAPIALGSAEGVFAAVHAGWRGLTAGVVEAAVRTMRSLGAGDVAAALGPCIHAECYAFGADDLDRVATVLGDRVRGRTGDGRPALDLPAAVAAALAASDVAQVSGVDACTACADGYFSHRARGDEGRQALVVWSAAAGPR
jgi:YfiH family protein